MAVAFAPSIACFGDCLTEAHDVSINAVIEEIEYFMDAYRPHSNSIVLPALVEYYSVPEHFALLVNQVLASDSTVTVDESFIHPSGFDKIVLLAGRNFKLRVHNFHPTNVQRPSENIHNHRWEFASSIVAGYFVADFYEEDNEGDTERLHYTYHSETGMSCNGKANLRKVSTTINAKGSAYFLPADKFHSIVDISPNGAVSVMATGFANGLTTTVYAQEEQQTGAESASCGLGMFTKEQLIETLADIQARL